MTNFVCIALAGLIILGIARYNRSNKLFWQLLMCFLFGFACAHAGKIVKGNADKGTTISIPTHQPSAWLFDAIIPESTVIEKSTNDVSKEEVERDIVLNVCMRTSAPLEENKGDPSKYFNTS